jgi:3D (Asp-Asp-Asp) domain-containing protein
LRPIITAALALAVIAGASGEAAAGSKSTRVGEIGSLASQAENAVRGWKLRATLYHAGGGGATGRDSLGCQPVAMRTVATDPKVIPRRTKLFIAETVGMRMPNGERHDGIWYASDTGGAVKGSKIDLYTGHGRASMSPAMRHNTRTLTVSRAGTFRGCPPPTRTQMAKADTAKG